MIKVIYFYFQDVQFRIQSQPFINLFYMSAQILQYRNGVYQGGTKGPKRHGQGILITDDGQIFIGQWKNDLLCGNTLIFLDHSEYGFGQFNRGQIEGYFVFRKNQKTLFSEFNMSRPINKMLLIDKEKQSVQTIAHRSPIYEVLQEKAYKGQGQEELVEKVLNIKFPLPPLIDFLQKYLRHKYKSFQLKTLQNGNTLFLYDDQSNPYSIGFSLNKNSQLISYGIYMNDRLNGMGCKYENTVRYEGIFQNGFMNGIGLKCSQGKYSFGEFVNGNLTEAIFIEQRSNMSEEKLKQFKKVEHIRSIWHCNAYVKKNLMKFKGTKELIFEANTQQEYLYPQTISNKPASNNKTKNIALKMINRDEFQTKSSKSFIVKPVEKNPEEDDQIMSQTNKSGFNVLTSLRKFKY